MCRVLPAVSLLVGLFLLQVLVDGLCGAPACAHGEDYGGCSGHCVASGEDAGTGGLPFFIGYDAAFAVCVKAFGGGLDEGVGACAESHYHYVTFYLKLAAFNGFGAAAA